MVAIIASVEPQVTVSSVSGSTSSPRYHFVFRAIASRKSRAPQVIAYWLTSSAMARRAASLTSSGAGKSGNPCDRLTAPYFMASRVISRMTDSVNRLARCDTRARVPGAVEAMWVGWNGMEGADRGGAAGG
jgi:hypothetical protein